MEPTAQPSFIPTDIPTNEPSESPTLSLAPSQQVLAQANTSTADNISSIVIAVAIILALLGVSLFTAVFYYYRNYIMKKSAAASTQLETNVDDPRLLNWSGQVENGVTVVGGGVGVDMLYRQSEFNNGLVRSQINPVVLSKENSIKDLTIRETSQREFESGIPSEFRASLTAHKVSSSSRSTRTFNR